MPRNVCQYHPAPEKHFKLPNLLRTTLTISIITMRVSTFLFGTLVISLGSLARAQCSQFIPVHEILSAPAGVLTIDDEAGSRQIRAETFNTADCDINPARPTGVQFSDNYTTMGQKSSDPNGCEVKNIGGVATMDSIQAIRIDTNGWTMNDVQFDFDDLDSSALGWKEVIGVTGFRNGAVVTPTVTLASPTLLSTRTYNIPTSVTTLLNLGNTPIDATGAEYSSSSQVNCPFEDSISARRCRASIQFSGPIDMLVIFYAVTERGRTDSQSGAFFSELRMSCGCRCRQTNPGTRMAFSSVPGVPGECVQRMISSPRSECDILGTKWCGKQDAVDYVLSGGLLASGNYGCTARDSTKVAFINDFSPMSTFSGTL